MAKTLLSGYKKRTKKLIIVRYLLTLISFLFIMLYIFYNLLSKIGNKLVFEITNDFSII